MLACLSGIKALCRLLQRLPKIGETIPLRDEGYSETNNNSAGHHAFDDEFRGQEDRKMREQVRSIPSESGEEEQPDESADDPC